MAKKPTKGITTPKGFRAAGGACGIKPSGKPDLALIVADQPCTAAGVFTTSKTPAPPVTVGRRNIRSGRAQAIVCNSGIANASTGKAGERHALQMCQRVAKSAGIDSSNEKLVIAASTGVIGVPLPMDKIGSKIESLADQLARGPKADTNAAQAIMTTDLVPKHAYKMLRLPAAARAQGGEKGGKTVHIAGICKGSGMIAPNMATMLAFITTDVNIKPALLKKALGKAVAESFNRISVDQHTSPSDMVLVLASGLADNTPINRPGKDLNRFRAALTDLCKDMAYQIVKDGEGATKVFRVCVTGAKNQKDADRVGKSIVDSPLVKTAVHGGDPNWGRIVTAAGYSGAAIQPDRLTLSISSLVGPGLPGQTPRSKSTAAATRKTASRVCVLRRGKPVTLPAPTQRKLTKIMATREIIFEINLGLGTAKTEWLGCDISKQYVTINADYTT